MLEQVEKSKYIGAMIAVYLDLNHHINSIVRVTKANRCLGFIERNSKCLLELRELAYLCLLGSQLEYTCIAWHPYQIINIPNLERAQRKSARFVKQDCSKHNSVTGMIHELGWKNYKIKG